jgi:ATP-dependent Clp protease ATP-binding subunit ClpA
MAERFVKEARAVAAAAEAEARAGGSPTIEAHHLLLALASDVTGVAGDVLRTCGLDHAAIEGAVASEFEQTLSAVGVSLDALPLRRRLPYAGRPRWAASGKSALEHALGAARERGDRRIGSGHVLLGVLAAEHGTVPRALRLAGVEPEELVAATRAAMDRH